jgi:hypothetical protein
MKLQKQTGVGLFVFLIVGIGLLILETVHNAFAISIRPIICRSGEESAAYVGGYKDGQLSFIILHGTGYNNTIVLTGAGQEQTLRLQY